MINRLSVEERLLCWSVIENYLNVIDDERTPETVRIITQATVAWFVVIVALALCIDNIAKRMPA